MVEIISKFKIKLSVSDSKIKILDNISKIIGLTLVGICIVLTIISLCVVNRIHFYHISIIDLIQIFYLFIWMLICNIVRL
jgi:hypothetical protein